MYERLKVSGGPLIIVEGEGSEGGFVRKRIDSCASVGKRVSAPHGTTRTKHETEIPVSLMELIGRRRWRVGKPVTNVTGGLLPSYMLSPLAE